MIAAYFDESGSHEGSQRLSLAGYLFTADQAKEFDREWQQMLARFGLPHFHMSDCAHGVGLFARLKELGQCDEAARMAVGIICRRACLGVVASVSEDDFRTVKQEAHAQGIRFDGNSYRILIGHCMLGASQWVKSRHPGLRIGYCFESGNRMQQNADRAFRSLRSEPGFVDTFSYHSHAFVNKNEAMGVQAADILAWEWNKEYVNRYGPRRRPRRLSLERLLSVLTVQTHYEIGHIRHLLRVAARS